MRKKGNVSVEVTRAKRHYCVRPRSQTNKKKKRKEQKEEEKTVRRPFLKTDSETTFCVKHTIRTEHTYTHIHT